MRIGRVGDPLDNLPHAAAESRAVAQVWQVPALCSVDATTARVLDQLRGSRVAHLACHGASLAGHGTGEAACGYPRLRS